MGQCQRMTTSIQQPAAANNLWSPTNLTATGTDGTPAVLCAPNADFLPRPSYVCEGSTVTFEDWSYGAPISSRLWTFPGGTPATDIAANPVITYNTAGVYDVTLQVTNAAGSDSKTYSQRVVVSPTNTSVSVPFVEGFEGGAVPNDWYTYNSNGGSEWEI